MKAKIYQQIAAGEQYKSRCPVMQARKHWMPLKRQWAIQKCKNDAIGLERSIPAGIQFIYRLL